MDKDLEFFIKDYLKEIQEENAAIFAGAGLSVSAGFVNWRELLRPIADELGLDIDKEHDLISIAQYHYNENGENRHKLNQAIITELTKHAIPTENHKILATLPINTYWTTNYDRLIETSLEKSHKIPDVKYTVKQLAYTKPRRDAIVYKMHGDVEHPSDAVLIKDDYERYAFERGAFLEALSGDLVSKTFLFLGFSFTDPNLDYVLGNIRVRWNKDQRRHYSIIKRVTPTGSGYDELKQTLVIKDLLRFNIKTILVDEYRDITTVLRRIENLYKQKTIFISGSAHDYGTWGQQATGEFLYDFSKALVQKNYKLVTGLGLGIGDAVITGAIEQIYAMRSSHIEDYLIMRPFPQATPDPGERKRLWEDYRHDLISKAGIGIFVLGNKLQDGKTVSAGGVRREFEIAKEMGVKLVPVGASEYVSRELWNEIMSDFENFYPDTSAPFKAAFAKLGESTDKPSNLISSILDVLNLLSKEK